MNETVSLRLTFPYWTMYKATLQVLFRAPLQIVTSLVFPLAGVYLIYLWVTHHHQLQLADIPILILCFLFTPLMTALSVYLARRKNALSQGAFTYTFNSEGIHISGDLASSMIKWQAVRKVRESSTFMFFYIAPVKAISIPIERFVEAGCLDAVRSLVKTYAGRNTPRDAAR